jgi:hypothetical protein
MSYELAKEAGHGLAQPGNIPGPALIIPQGGVSEDPDAYLADCQLLTLTLIGHIKTNVLPKAWVV